MRNNFTYNIINSKQAIHTKQIVFYVGYALKQRKKFLNVNLRGNIFFPQFTFFIFITRKTKKKLIIYVTKNCIIHGCVKIRKQKR